MVWLKHYRAWAAWQGGVGPLWPGGGATIRVFDVFHQFIVFLRLRRICNCCNNIFSESNNDIDRATTILGLKNRVDKLSNGLLSSHRFAAIQFIKLGGIIFAAIGLWGMSGENGFGRGAGRDWRNLREEQGRNRKAFGGFEERSWGSTKADHYRSRKGFRSGIEEERRIFRVEREGRDDMRLSEKEFIASERRRLTQNGKWLDCNEFLRSIERSNFKHLREHVDVQCILKMVREVSLSVELALASTLILTLHDLHHTVVKNLHAVKEFQSFEGMGLGKLTKIPKVVQAFQIPPDIQDSGQIPEITTADLLEFFAVKFGEEDFAAYRLKQKQLEPQPQPQVTGENLDMERLQRYLDALAAVRGLEGGGAWLCVHVKNPAFIGYLLRKIRGAHSYAFRHFVKKLKHAYEDAHMRLLEAVAEDLATGAEREYNLLYNAAQLKLDSDENGQRSVGKQLLILEQEVVRLEALTVRADWPPECRSKFHQIFSLLLCALSGPAPKPGSRIVSNSLRLREKAKGAVELEAALLQVIHADELTGPSDLVAFLRSIECRFCNAIGASSPEDAPFTVLEFIAHRPALAEALQMQIAAALRLSSVREPIGHPYPGDARAGSWERDAAGTEAEIVDHLRGIFDSLRAAAAASGRPLDLLSALAAAEERILEERRPLKAFTSLHHGPFAAFCLRHKERLLPSKEEYGRRLTASAIDGEPNGAQSNSWQRVARQVADALQLCEKTPTAEPVAAALCCHFEVPELAGLGLTASELQAWLDSSHMAPRNPSGGQAAQSAACASALVSAWSDSSAAGYYGTLSRLAVDKQARVTMSDEQGVTALLRSPMLVDLAQWTDWATSFEPSLGGIGSFLERSTSLLRAGGGDRKRGETEVSEAVSGLRALEVVEGSFVLIPFAADVRLFGAAVKRRDGVQAAAQAVGLLADCGHVSLAPIDALQESVKTSLEESASGDDRAAAAFVATALAALPRVFLLPLGLPVFVEPFREAIPRWCDLLLDVCSPSLHARQALESLGLTMRVDKWAEARHSRLFGQGPIGEDERSVLISMTSKVKLEHSRNKRSNLPGNSPVNATVSQIELPVICVPPPAPGLTVVKSSSPSLESSMDECAALCESIRQEMAIGKDDDSIKSLQGRLHRALTRLAADLYSKDIHFVLEIVQNADDNSYDDEVEPSLEICLTTDHVQFKNNEVGFSTENVRALCDVGASTKEGAAGYIGHKGESA